MSLTAATMIAGATPLAIQPWSACCVADPVGHRLLPRFADGSSASPAADAELGARDHDLASGDSKSKAHQA
jgi:hypothetical protein